MDHQQYTTARNNMLSTRNYSPPRKKVKHSYNVGSIFNQQVKAKVTAPSGPVVQKQDPDYRRFLAAKEKYQKSAAAAGEPDLRPIHDELIARANGMTIYGKPLHTPGVPTQEEIDAIAAEERIISRPLDDDVMTLTDNGNRRKARLGDTFKAFEESLAKAKADIERFEQQIKEIDADIKAAREALLHAEEEGKVKKLKDKVNKKLDAYKKEAMEIEEWTRSEIEKGKEEDRKARADLDRKLEQFIMADMT